MKVLGKNISLWSTIRGNCKQLECSSISICSDCYKISEIGWLRKTDIYFLTVLEADRLRWEPQSGQFLERALFLAYRQPPFHCVLTWISLGWLTEQASSLMPPLIMTPVLLYQGATLKTSFHLNYFLKDSLSKYSHNEDYGFNISI